MISCQKATMLLLKEEEGKLPFSDRLMLKLHLFLCTKCKRFSKQSRFLAQSIENYLARKNATAASSRLSAEKKQELQALIDNDNHQR